MDARIKEKWIAALESGDYQQGQSCLRDAENRFCCLGVLCDVIDPQAWQTEVNMYGRTGFLDAGEDYNIFLPPVLAREIGLDYAGQALLANLNDGMKMDFAGIAAYIRTNF